jgi:two-component system, OmpR family, sensor kinase
MNWTIRARLTAWYTGVTVAVLVVGAVVVALVQERRALNRVDEDLSRMMLALHGMMREEFGEGHDVQRAASEASTEMALPDRAVAIADPDGRFVRSWGRDVHSPRWPLMGDVPPLRTEYLASARYRVLRQRMEVDGKRYVAAIAAPLAEHDAEDAALRNALGWGIFVAMLAAGVGGWLVGRQSLRPLSDMARQAKTTAADRMPVGHLTALHPGDELGTLATAFNGLLDRLAAVIDTQRQFMADASHELRTPVSVVRTTAQVTMARDVRSADEYRESMTIVGEQAERLSKLVDSMFLLSRAEADGVHLVREPLYLDDIVTETTRALRVLAETREVTLESAIDGEVAFVGDDGLLRQMVGNLVDNAIRHAARRGTVRVSLQASGHDAVIRVADDGRGIPEAQQKRIFERFVRLEADYTGAGLGLPIARWIAEAHAGQLILESTGSGGSVFAAILPLAERTAA